MLYRLMLSSARKILLHSTSCNAEFLFIYLQAKLLASAIRCAAAGAHVV
jgi:hypothetical protein